MNTLTHRSTRLVGFMVATVITFALNGAMLWKFDAVATQHAVAAHPAASPVMVTLDRVTVVAPRS